MKNKKQKLIEKRMHIIMLIAFFAGALAIGITSKFTENKLSTVIPLIQPVKAQGNANLKPRGVVEEVLGLVRDAGLNEYEAWAIIQCESRWKADAIKVEPNGTYSAGLWQINSIHKNINNTDKLNYIKATKWAIEKRLKDGNWLAWTCS